MKVGDLVKHRCPTTRDDGKVFIVVKVRHDGRWVYLHNERGFIRGIDLEVISESR